MCFHHVAPVVYKQISAKILASRFGHCFIGKTQWTKSSRDRCRCTIGQCWDLLSLEEGRHFTHMATPQLVWCHWWGKTAAGPMWTPKAISISPKLFTLLYFYLTLVIWFILVTKNNCPLAYYIVHTLTRIPSGIESRLLTHGPPKFDHESLYEPIKFETLQPYLVNKY